MAIRECVICGVGFDDVAEYSSCPHNRINKASPESERVDAYLNTVGRLEPDIAPIDVSAFYASAAVSLKRIADVLSRGKPPGDNFIVQSRTTFPSDNTWMDCFKTPDYYRAVEYQTSISGTAIQTRIVGIN